MDRFDPFVKYADVYGDIINWEKDPMNKPQNQNKYFFSDGKTYYEQICKMLRLMSVFKEAFNQIYSNEDEISEAWENFVNNLSASVVEGSEPDVTLTWTDDSVNFEFTMVPGVPGEQGVGITSISFNSDYTMTITLSDGNTYTSMSLKGETGPQGPQGETGSGLQILDVYATLADLQSAHPTGEPGDAYQVGSAGNYTLYIWSSSQSAWVQAGTLGTVSPYTSAPLMDGTASSGSQNLYARGDHVHPSDTSRASKEELDALIKTSQSLIDQSFTYRESPAIQDGLARIDKIKGNTLVWNQEVGTNVNGLNTTSGTTFTLNSNGSIHVTGTGTGNHFCEWRTVENPSFIMVKGHKYLVKFKGLTTGIVAQVSVYTTQTTYLVNKVNFIGDYDEIITPLQDGITGSLVRFYTTNTFSGTTDIIMQLFDLTQMGLDITDPSEFTSLFPLSYYSYNQGSLLSFNGSGLKITGKNLLPNSEYTTNASGATFKTINVDGFPVGTAILSCEAEDGTGVSWQNAQLQFRKGTTVISSKAPNAGTSFTLPDIDSYDNVLLYTTDALANKLLKWQLEYGTNPSEYEPYTSSTLSFPISTYFPTGMKSAGNVYDELTESKAITRLKKVTYSSSTGWATRTTGSGWILYEIAPSDIKDVGTRQNATIKNNRFEWVLDLTYNNTIRQVGGRISVRKDDITSLDAWGTYLASNPLEIIYELATPVETAVDLDLSFNSYEDGTEQLLPVNDSVPSTSPIIADMTYMSIDDAMEYIIDKLSNVPQNTQQILDALEDDVADLQTDVGALQPAVSALQTSVGNINTNIGQLSSTVAGHTASISDMQSDISDMDNSITSLEGTVTNNSSKIGTLETGLSTTNGNVQNLSTSVSDLDSTVTAQGETVTALDNFVSNIANTRNPGYMSSDNSIGITSAFLNMTLAAGQSTWANIPIPTIMAGFIPLFVVGASTGDGSVCLFKIPSTYNQNNIYKVGVKNTSNSEVTTQVGIEILCIKQRQSQ